jgi:hypothetical protein
MEKELLRLAGNSEYEAKMFGDGSEFRSLKLIKLEDKKVIIGLDDSYFKVAEKYFDNWVKIYKLVEKELKEGVKERQ